MKEIISIAIAILLFAVVVILGICVFRSIVREIDRMNKQRRKAIEDDAKSRKECRDKLFYWWARVSDRGSRV